MHAKQVFYIVLLITVLIVGALVYVSATSKSCTQVLVTATNRFTGDRKIFMNPCSVPLWYTHVQDYNDQEVKFIGTINAIDDQVSSGGPISIQVDDKWITAPGALMASGTKLPAGSIIGYDPTHAEVYIGKKAEVYAAQMVPDDQSSLTLIGSSAYFVKIIQTTNEVVSTTNIKSTEHMLVAPGAIIANYETHEVALLLPDSECSVAGKPEKTYLVERSTNNRDWQKVATTSFYTNDQYDPLFHGCENSFIDSTVATGTGIVFYRYHLIDAQGNIIESSPVGTVTMEDFYETPHEVTPTEFCNRYKGTWLPKHSECEWSSTDISSGMCESAKGTFSPCASACRHMGAGYGSCIGQCVSVCSF